MANLGNDLHGAVAGTRCPHCGSTYQAKAKFCGGCGQEVVDRYIGKLLNNRFLIESKIGEGGFGAVYRGQQTGIRRKVALKLLHPDMNQDENLVERFRREGLVLCNLRDAHTITTYDFDQTDDGTLYIAMELLEGRSLQHVFDAEKRLAWRRMFKILSEMCTSLAEAHAHGIVHRDLKPENIYLENRPGNPDFVKILDFGIAKVVQGDMVGGSAAQLTATGQTLGTLEYMSPEQLMGKELDGRSDIYALGVLTYEMITGRLPFPNAKGPAGLITAQLRQVPDPPSVACPAAGIPAVADQIILEMLEKDKTKRFHDVDQLRNLVLEFIGSGQWDISAHNLEPRLADLSHPSLHDVAGKAAAGPARSLTPPPPALTPAMPASGMPAGHASHPGAPQGHPAGPQGHPAGPQGHPRAPQAAGPAPQARPQVQAQAQARHLAPSPAGPPQARSIPLESSSPSLPSVVMAPLGHMPEPSLPSYPRIDTPPVMGSMIPAHRPSQGTGSRVWIWAIVALVVLGTVIGAALALT